MPMPVIAAVNGPAVGGGLALAVGCDIRIGSTHAAFVAGFTRRGLIAELGLAHSLPSLVGLAAATEFLLSGRRVGAEEALRLGLLTRVCEPETLLSEVTAYAKDIATNVAPRSAAMIKRQLWESSGQTFAESFNRAHEYAAEALASDDFREGLAAYKERRPPRYPRRLAT